MASIQQGLPDARPSWRSISRQWRIVGGFFAVGLLVALAYTVLSPRRLVAHSVVLLPATPANGSAAPTRDMGTEARIATSSPVLAKAIKAAGVSVSVDDLRQRVAASAETTSLLDVQVEDSSASRAITLSNAVARGYVAYSTKLARQSEDALVRTLRARASELSVQLYALEVQVADQTAKWSSLPAGTSTAAARAGVNALEARRTAVTQDLNDVNQAIDTAKLNGSAQVNGLQVLEPATRATGPSQFATALPFLIAALVALAAGSATAVWKDGRDDRVRRRNDIAAAIGAPVLAALRARGGSEADSSAAAHEATSKSDQHTLHQLEHRLAQEGDAGTEFVVVALSGDDAAILVVRQLSEAAAQSGLDAAVFAPQSRQSLDGLLVPPKNLRNENGKTPKIYESHEALGDAAPSADLVIVLVITDGSKLELPHSSASMPAVMIVSAGFARHVQLATVSALMRAAGRPFAGVIVTNPDPRDDSSTWQLPTTEPQLAPSRITGVPEKSVS